MMYLSLSITLFMKNLMYRSAHINVPALRNIRLQVICASYNMNLSNKHVDNGLFVVKGDKILLVQCTSCVNF